MASTDRSKGAAPDRYKRAAAPFLFKVRGWLVLLAITLLASGCVTLDDPEVSQEHSTEAIAALLPGQVFEQSLRPRQPGLSQITIYLSGGEPGWLDVEVLAEAQDTPISSQQFPLPQSSGSSPLTIQFPAQPLSGEEIFRLRLSTRGGKINVMGRPEDLYPEGSASLDGVILTADAAFRTAYRYEQAHLLGDIAAWLPHLWLALPLAALLILPGWALLLLSGLGSRFSLPETAGISVGVSLAFYPLLFTWTGLLGLKWNTAAITILLLLFGIAGLWNYVRRRKHAPDPGAARMTGTGAGWSAVMLFAIFLASLVVRGVMVRNLSAPPWVDSIHHGLITRLILEGGAFPLDYAPYLQIAPTAYHPGFHAVLAVFLWLSRMELAAGMLLFGQVLNALAAPAAYLLGAALTRDRDAGLAAALVAGLVSPMPAYFTSWGRYTHLAGLLILPAAAALVLAILDSLAEPAGDRKLRIRTAWLAGLATAGLFLTHYRVAAFFACLLFAHLTAWLVAQVQVKSPRLKTRVKKIQSLLPGLPGLRRRRAAPDPGRPGISPPSLADGPELPVIPEGDDIPHTGEIRNLEPVLEIDASVPRRLGLPGLGWAALVLLGAAVFALPWLPGMLRDLLLPKLQNWQGSPVPAFSDFSWSFLNAARGELVLQLAGAGLALGLLMRRPAAISMPLWAALMFLLANLDVLGLPGSGLVNDLSVTISLYLPLSVLVGLLAAGVNRFARSWIPRRWYFLYAVLLAGGAAYLGLLGTRALAPLLNPVTFTYRQADRGALDWLAENSDPGQTVLTNPFAWGYGVYAGQDGGYWASALSGRPTLPPPVIYSLGEDAAGIEATTQAVQQVMQLASDPPALRDWMLAHQIRLLIIGRRGGVFSPHRLVESGFFTARYSQDGAWVLEAVEP